MNRHDAAPSRAPRIELIHPSVRRNLGDIGLTPVSSAG
jgi:hypothetical protein